METGISLRNRRAEIIPRRENHIMSKRILEGNTRRCIPTSKMAGEQIGSKSKSTTPSDGDQMDGRICLLGTLLSVTCPSDQYSGLFPLGLLYARYQYS